MSKTSKALIVAIAALGLGVASIQATEQVSAGYRMPMNLKLTVNSGDCYNSPGPWVTLEGEISLGGLNAQLIFQNNVKGTHQNIQQVGSPMVLIPEDASITIPKQPVRGGVGGNPWIYVQFYNEEGNLTPEILLGRCVQGLNLDLNVVDASLVSLLVEAGDCSNNPGPWITLSGDMTLGGLYARIIFKNNAKGTHTNTQTVEVELLGEGTKVVIPKQPSRGGVGGNPWIWLQFLPDGDPIFLGRCQDI